MNRTSWIPTVCVGSIVLVLATYSVFYLTAGAAQNQKESKAEQFIAALGYSKAYKQFLEGAPLPPPVGSKNDPNYQVELTDNGKGILTIKRAPALRKVTWIIVGPKGTVEYATKDKALAGLKDYKEATHVFGAVEHITVLPPHDLR